MRKWFYLSFLTENQVACIMSVSSDLADDVQEPPPQERPQEKRKRRSYDLAFKMEVVAYAEAHNKMKAARKYDIHRRCVQFWCKTKDKLESAANSKRMRLSVDEQQALASTEILEVSISGITEEGELLSAALPVTCASIVNNCDVTEICGGAALTMAVNTILHT